MPAMLRRALTRCLQHATECSTSGRIGFSGAASSGLTALGSGPCSTSGSMQAIACLHANSCRSSLVLPALQSHSRAVSTSGRMLDAPRSILGTHGSMTAALGDAAEQRLSRIKAEHPNEAAAAAAAAGGDTPRRSFLGEVLSLLGRTIMITGTAATLAASYYTYRYDLSEVQHMIEETKAKPDNAFVGSKVWVDIMETYASTRANVEKQIKSFRDPTYDRLLPDMRPEMKAMGIKTLVLDLNDVLVSKHWTRKKGWTLYKRPGAQEFLFEMGQYFEVVIFTDEPSAYAIPVINKLDKNQVVPYRLFRPETQYHEGKHVRDLSKLNRDLSQVLFVSANPHAYAFQPENTLKLKPWKDDPSDTTLLDLMPMLQMVALKGVKDVRDVVKSYDGEEDVAKAFKRRMQQVSQHQKQPKSRGLLTFK